MARSVPLTSEAERNARVIVRCYSRTTLELAAQELGVPVSEDSDIFRALIVAKVATDFDAAVRLVAEHLDNSSFHLPMHSGELVNGKVERRKAPRRHS